MLSINNIFLKIWYESGNILNTGYLYNVYIEHCFGDMYEEYIQKKKYCDSIFYCNTSNQ